MSDKKPSTRDAVGQFILEGDLVGGVRPGRYPVTVGGRVTKIGTDGARVKVLVKLVTGTGDQARRSNPHANLSMPEIGDEVWLYRERVFRVDVLFTGEEETV